MTKAIEDELGLPSLADALSALNEGEEDNLPHPEVEQMANALQNMGTPRSSDVMGVDDHEDESDEIYQLAMRAHKDLIDLGFNIEPKNAGPNAFQPALKALEIALKASQSKKTAKMERIQLIMDQERHAKEMNNGVEDGEIIESGGKSIVANRNDLMEKIRKGEI